MYFYEVAPASRRYHGNDILTYNSSQQLESGAIVVVKIRSQIAPAFVVRKVPKPEFTTQAIVDNSPIARLPAAHMKLFAWMQAFYPAPVGILAQLFLSLSKPTDYLESRRHKKIAHRTAAETDPEPLPPLTKDQAAALNAIHANKLATTVLHGDTGTGKTRLYIELAQEALAAKKSVIILVPEISLSPQMINSLTTATDAPVHMIHSALTPAQRRNTWHKIARTTDPQIVIGPRSALFAPVDSVGLIVVDEFHEPAYKQDQSPYYQTIRVASYLAYIHGARLILGSATPPVGEYYVAEQKSIPIVRMQQKAKSPTGTTQILVANLKESDQKTRYPLVSTTLLEQIRATLANKQQVLLFLNKRGSARLILCQDCGWHALCDRCDLPYTYHGDHHQLICHTCGRQEAAPSICPSCTSHDIVFKSPGTKAIVEAIHHAFPEANIARFDRDNRKAERLESRHQEVLDGAIDIIVGTQLLAKGHDLPRLALVGIMLAENELQFPDYSSSERSYQLIHQLTGRVGRGHTTGTVVVQTYDPANIAVQTATGAHDWQSFYKAQLEERDAFVFPPFCHLMKLEISRARLSTVQSVCEQIIKHIADCGEPVSVIGPTPSFIEKRNNTWNWQIIVKAKQRSSLTNIAKSLPVQCTVNLDPLHLL